MLAAITVLAALTAAQPAPVQSVTPEGMEWATGSFQFSPAVRVGDMVYVSGIIARRPAAETPSQADYEAEFDAAFRTLASVLDAADAGFEHVVEMTSFHVDMDDPTHRNAFLASKQRFVVEPYPAWTAIGIDRLWTDEGLVEVRLTAYAPLGD